MKNNKTIKKKYPKVLYREGENPTPFFLNSDGETYSLAKDMRGGFNWEWSYDRLMGEKDYFFKTEKEAIESYNNKRVGFRWVVSEWGHFEPILQKYNKSRDLWEEIPTVVVEGP